jgi:plastocyanin
MFTPPTSGRNGGEMFFSLSTSHRSIQEVGRMHTARRLTVRRRGKVAAIVAAGATGALLTGGTSLAAADGCGAQAIEQPLIDHVNSAHLERSPLQQARDLADLDDYVLAHTVLVESVLAPVLSTANAALDPLVQHVYSAHLERSPLQQARDLADLDDYVLAHTVLVESMIKPVVEGCADAGEPAPAPATMPAHGGMPAPEPGPAPEPAPAPGPAPAPAASPAAPASVEIHDYAFAPKTLMVPVGTTVRWTNHDGDTHTVTGAGLKSKSFGMNAAYSYTFTQAGTFSYVCSLHPQMKGTVVVH